MQMIPDCGVPHGSGHRKLAVPGHHGWYHSHCVSLLSKRQTELRDRRQPPLGGRRTSSCSASGGGGTYAKPLRTMLKRGITYMGRVDLGFSLVDVDLEGKARQPPW